MKEKSKYSFIEKVIDGISVSIKRIKLCAKTLPHLQQYGNKMIPNLYIDISRLDLYSTDEIWTIKELSKCIYFTNDKRNVIIHKVS